MAEIFPGMGKREGSYLTPSRDVLRVGKILAQLQYLDEFPDVMPVILWSPNKQEDVVNTV